MEDEVMDASKINIADEEEFEKVEDKKAVNSLPIYTEEELKQFADEEEEDDYDSDEYDEYEEEYGNY